MSRNYDNWERLVAAVLKRDQIWQLCHQDSISSSICSDDSSDLELKHPTATHPPLSLGSFRISRTFKFAPQLREGDFGTTHIALLLQDVRVADQIYFAKGSKAAIKLLKTVKVKKHEFEQQMIVLGNCRHENVGQPLAYYFSERRKLIVYDYYSKGSVFDMLHGHLGWLDWESRLRIAIGAARGIAHIHAQSDGTLAHGNIKSTNIFVNSQNYGCVSDFCFAGIIESKKPSQMSDVYSFGLLLLELVTREQPSDMMVRHTQYFEPYDEWDSYRKTEHQTELDWFAMHNGRSLKFFVGILVDEKDMAERYEYIDLRLDISSVHQDLHKTLRVAQRCLEINPESRPTMSDVVLMLQNIPQSRRRPPKPSSELIDGGASTKAFKFTRYFIPKLF